MRCPWFCLLAMVSFWAGCTSTRVNIDGRLVSDSALWHHLDGPDYRIVGITPLEEASLEFQASADLLAAALRAPRPNLRRLAGSPGAPENVDSPGEALARPDLVFTLSFQVADRGMVMESYPVYGRRGVTVFGPHGRARRYYSPVYAGQAVQPVHLGFSHSASLTAWVWDHTQPAGRRVIWEGRAGMTRQDPDLRGSMPFLAFALATYYGQETDSWRTMKFKRHDERIQALHDRHPATADDHGAS